MTNIVLNDSRRAYLAMDDYGECCDERAETDVTRGLREALLVAPSSHRTEELVARKSSGTSSELRSITDSTSNSSTASVPTQSTLCLSHFTNFYTSLLSMASLLPDNASVDDIEFERIVLETSLASLIEDPPEDFEERKRVLESQLQEIDDLLAARHGTPQHARGAGDTFDLPSRSSARRDDDSHALADGRDSSPLPEFPGSARTRELIASAANRKRSTGASSFAPRHVSEMDNKRRKNSASPSVASTTDSMDSLEQAQVKLEKAGVRLPSVNKTFLERMKLEEERFARIKADEDFARQLSMPSTSSSAALQSPATQSSGNHTGSSLQRPPVQSSIPAASLTTPAAPALQRPAPSNLSQGRPPHLAAAPHLSNVKREIIPPASWDHLRRASAASLGSSTDDSDLAEITAQHWHQSSQRRPPVVKPEPRPNHGLQPQHIPGQNVRPQPSSGVGSESGNMQRPHATMPASAFGQPPQPMSYSTPSASMPAASSRYPTLYPPASLPPPSHVYGPPPGSVYGPSPVPTWSQTLSNFGNTFMQGIGTTMAAIGGTPYTMNSLGSGGRYSALDDLDTPALSRPSLYDDNVEARGLGYLLADGSHTRAELESLLENIRPDEDLPPELRLGTPDAMVKPLMEHQKLGLAWLKQQEESSNKGGILADDMGLGKTIQALALMLERPSEDRLVKTNLIIAPVALLAQWEAEIKDKIKPGHQLSTYVYHGNKKKSFAELRKHDVVLTTFGTLASEYKAISNHELWRQSNPNARLSKVCNIIGAGCTWYRVIIDEAQYIKNKNTGAAHGAYRINAQYRLCMTGTPMMNGVSELYSLIKFCRIKPYNSWNEFNRTFMMPLKGHNDVRQEQAMQALQALLRAILLRRNKKSKIDGKAILDHLKERTTEEVETEFSTDEEEFYRALETRTQLQVNKYLQAGKIGKNYSNMLVLLLRLRQACCHPHLIKDHAIEGSGSLDDVPPENLEKIAKDLSPETVARIKAADGAFECPVCFDGVENPTIFFPCGHDMCSECFSKLLEDGSGVGALFDDSGVPVSARGSMIKCPECRGPVDAKKIINYTIFKKVYLREQWERENPLLVEGEGEEAAADPGSVSDSDSDSSDDCDESDAESEDTGSADSIEEFIAPDDEDDEEVSDVDRKSKIKKIKSESRRKSGFREPRDLLAELHGSSTEDEGDAPLRARRSSRKVIKDEEDVDGDATTEDDMPGADALCKGPIKDESPDNIKDVIPPRTTREVEKLMDNKKSKGKGKGKKSKGKKKKNKVKSIKTLAELKKEAMRNAGAKKKYLKRLRKEFVTSSKLDKTIALLNKIRDNDPTEKTIIFSQFNVVTRPA
ncbi:hypothetical protein MRB53_038108 [Persea americana]|nr:hypothetical protein MRB53_038108 [Persea americana]